MSPSLVCTEQLTTTVDVAGSGLSPAPIDVLTEEPGLRIPDLTLHRVGELDGSAADRTALELDEASGRIRWMSQESMSFEIFPELNVTPGLHDLTAGNLIAELDETVIATLPDGLMAVPPPTLSTALPNLICTAQYDNTLTLTGTGFLQVVEELPTVNFGPLQLPADSLDGCFDLAGPTPARTCSELTVTIPAAALGAGVWDVWVNNPDPAGCISTEAVQIEIIPPPSLDTVQPDLVCTDQFDNAFTLSGSNFLVKADGTLPTVDMGGYVSVPDSATGCVSLTGPAGGELCDTLTFTVPQQAVPVGVHEARVTNPDPAGCISTETVFFEVVPPPSLTAVDPEIVCVDQSDNTLTLTGTDFLVLADGTLPEVMVGTYTALADAAANCLPLVGPAGGELCTELTFTLPQGSLTVGVHDVIVTNPFTADCVSTESVQIEVVAPPSLADAQPDLVCNEQNDNTFTLTGSDFLEVGGVLPTVQIGAYAAPADAIGGTCTALTGPAGGQVCSELTITVAAGDLAPGVHDVIVTNPFPADCSSVESVQIETVDAPFVASLTPGSTCVGTPVAATTIDGSGFLVLSDGTEPSVTVGGMPVSITGRAGCAALTGPAGGEICDQLDITLPPGIFAVAGDHAVEVLNPGPDACGSNTDVVFSVSDPPIISDVQPDAFCEQQPETLTITGSNFTQGSIVLIDGSAAEIIDVRFIDSATLEVDITGALSVGFHDITVSNGPACEDTMNAAFEVVANPIVFFVDPPVIYSQITTQMTFYVSQVPSGIVEVSIEEAATGAVTVLSTWSYDGQNSITAEVPAGPLGLAEGDYLVHVVSGLGCPGFLDNAFFIEADLTVSIDDVDPPFGWEQEDTPTDVTARPPGAGEVDFEDLPRVYLNPVAGGTATALRSVSFQDSQLLNSVVPDGLPPGLYDVIVVNPSGAIGVLFGAFEVTALPPPKIDSVSPARGDSSNATPSTVNGANFRNPTVDLTCSEPGGAISTRVGNVTGFTGSTIDFIMPSDTLPSGTVCVVRVNNDDGTYFDYSAVSVGSPSGNLFAWSPGLPMVEARRAPAAVAGRATERARYLYAIGGDDGGTAGAKTTIEVSPLDPFGNMRPWRLLPGELPAPRTLAGVVRQGRFIYLVGGNDGLGPVDTVWRSQILDPLASPEFDGLAINFGSGSGLDGGTWIYRIAAVFDPADIVNPGGESLSSDPIVVQLPEVPDKIHLSLDWTAVPRAVGYKVYRSPAVDAGSNSEEFLALTLTNSFFDDGSGVTDPSDVPLPNGALGEWAEVALLPGTDALDAAREGPAVGLAEDPLTPSTYYVYVAGGRDGNGTVRDTINLLSVDGGTATHVPGAALIPSGATLATPKWKLGAWIVDDTFHTVVGPGETWLYFGSGATPAGTDGATEAMQVQAGGALLGFGDQSSVTPARSGYGFLSANNFLYLMGGERGATLAFDSGRECAISGPPGLDNWNSLGGSTLTAPRGLPGSAIESAVVFIVGGVNDLGQVQATTDFTNF